MSIEKLDANDRDILRQCVHYILYNHSHFVSLDDKLFEVCVGVPRAILSDIHLSWYSVKPTLADPDEYEKKMTLAVERLLNFTYPESEETWAQHVNATPEEVRAIVLKQKHLLQARKQEKLQRSWLRRAGRYVCANPTLIAGIGYLYLTTFGLIYKWTLYQSFGINLFDYAKVEDFLLAGFEQPSTLFYTVVGVSGGLVLLSSFISDYAHMSKLSRIFRIVIFIIGYTGWLLFPSWHIGNALADEIREGNSRLVRIEMDVNNRCIQEADLVRLIGKSGGFVFVFDAEEKLTIALAVSKIISLQFVEAGELIDQSKVKKHQDSKGSEK